MLVRQLEEELRARMRQPNIEMQQQIEAVYAENDHLQREISILRETIKDLECRVETQKQTLIARDESIKKLLEMLQAKGMGKWNLVFIYSYIHIFKMYISVCILLYMEIFLYFSQFFSFVLCSTLKCTTFCCTYNKYLNMFVHK